MLQSRLDCLVHCSAGRGSGSSGGRRHVREACSGGRHHHQVRCCSLSRVEPKQDASIHTVGRSAFARPAHQPQTLRIGAFCDRTLRESDAATQSSKHCVSGASQGGGAGRQLLRDRERRLRGVHQGPPRVRVRAPRRLRGAGAHVQLPPGRHCAGRFSLLAPALDDALRVARVRAWVRARLGNG